MLYMLDNTVRIPAHINSEENPDPNPCEITKGLVEDWCFLSTYKNAAPFADKNHLWAFET